MGNCEKLLDTIVINCVSHDIEDGEHSDGTHDSRLKRDGQIGDDEINQEESENQRDIF